MWPAVGSGEAPFSIPWPLMMHSWNPPPKTKHWEKIPLSSEAFFSETHLLGFNCCGPYGFGTQTGQTVSSKNAIFSLPIPSSIVGGSENWIGISFAWYIWMACAFRTVCGQLCGLKSSPLHCGSNICFILQWWKPSRLIRSCLLLLQAELCNFFCMTLLKQPFQVW